MVSKDKITTIKLKQSTRKKLQNLKKYPRETNEDTLIRLIKKEIENNAVNSSQLKKEDSVLKEADSLNNLNNERRKQ